MSPSPLCLDDLIYVDYLMGGSQQENGQSRTLGVGDVHRLHRLHDVLQFYKYKKNIVSLKIGQTSLKNCTVKEYDILHVFKC